MDQSTFDLGDSIGSNAVKFQLPAVTADHTNSSGEQVAGIRPQNEFCRITITAKSAWETGFHWHERYDEYLVVVKGRVLVVLEGKGMIIEPKDGTVTIPRGAVHAWMRADMWEMSAGGKLQRIPNDSPKPEDEVIVEEWTMPADGTKQVFFRNLIGVISDHEQFSKPTTILQSLYICAEYDNWNVFIGGTKSSWLSRSTTHSAFFVIRTLSGIFGMQPWHEKYTPVHLRDIAESKRLRSVLSASKMKSS